MISPTLSVSSAIPFSCECTLADVLSGFDWLHHRVTFSASRLGDRTDIIGDRSLLTELCITRVCLDFAVVESVPADGLGITPPINVLPSLSRLMKSAIGEGM